MHKTCYNLALIVLLAFSGNAHSLGSQAETNPARGRELAAAVNLHRRDMNRGNIVRAARSPPVSCGDRGD